MIIRIHDLPVKYPMDVGVSFHVNEDDIDRLWWDGKVLQVVTIKGEVWQFDSKKHQWSLEVTTKENRDGSY